MLIWSKKIHCEMLSSFLVNLREYWCSLVQCCQHVSRFTGAHARNLSSNYFIKSSLSYHIGLAGVKKILQRTFDFSTKPQTANVLVQFKVIINNWISSR